MNSSSRKMTYNNFSSILFSKKLCSNFIPILIAIGVTLFCLCMISLHPYAKDEHNYAKQYMSYEIQKGDTLWDISNQYNNCSMESSKDYILEVKRINHLDSDKIYAKSFLVIPYFVDNHIN